MNKTKLSLFSTFLVEYNILLIKWDMNLYRMLLIKYFVLEFVGGKMNSCQANNLLAMKII